MALSRQPRQPANQDRFAGTFARLARRYIIAAAGKKRGGMRLAFDLESDGLLDKATKIHCLVIGNVDDGNIDAYGPEQIPEALEHLARADCLIGHKSPALIFRFCNACTAGCRRRRAASSTPLSLAG